MTNDDREHSGQRAVQTERAQGASARGERAARARWGEFIEDHRRLVRQQIGIENLARDRRRRAAAVLAVLDEDGYGKFRILGRGK